MASEYSLSDLATASGGNGFGGNSAWVLIILFALIFGWGGNFGGNRYADSAVNTYATAASQQEILFGQQFGNLDNKIDRIGNGIADSTYALNNAITTEGRAVQSQLSNCCCENQRNVDSVRFDMANYASATQAAIHSEGEQTRALIQQNKIESLQQKISALEMQNAMSGVVRYPMSSTWAMSGNPFCGSCGGF